MDLDNYSVTEMRAHLRIAACVDGKLKEELLKLGQPENSNEPAEPVTSEAIWHATRNYKLRQKCLRSETDNVAVSSVSAASKGCRTCTGETSWNAKNGRYYDHCFRHSNKAKDTSDMECSLQHCGNSRGDHNTAAHKRFGPGTNNYRSNTPSPTRGRQFKGKANSGNTSRGGSKSPKKYSRNNSQNREVVRQSKEGSAAVSAITTDATGSSGASIMDEADMFVDSDGSSLEY